MDSENLPKEPFRNYTLDEEKKKKRDIFTVSLTDEDRKNLDKFKEDAKIPSDARAYKELFRIGVNAINSTIGSDFIRYLASNDRVKKP
jgi:hypothetical protein